MIETLKEKLNALEDVEKGFVARNDILHRLNSTLGQSRSSDLGTGLPREGHRCR